MSGWDRLIERLPPRRLPYLEKGAQARRAEPLIGRLDWACDPGTYRYKYLHTYYVVAFLYVSFFFVLIELKSDPVLEVVAAPAAQLWLGLVF